MEMWKVSGWNGYDLALLSYLTNKRMLAALNLLDISFNADNVIHFIWGIHFKELYSGRISNKKEK